MDNELEYKDQSALDLQLNVIEGSFDLNQFTILGDKELVSDCISLRARIIGASHLITFRINGLEFHEIFACGEVKTDGKRAFCGPLKNVSGSVKINFASPFVAYKFDCRIVKMNNEGESMLAELEKEVNDITDRNLQSIIGLTYEFPKEGDLRCSPKTIVMATMSTQDSVNITTAHSYPNENNLVLTSTFLCTI